VRAIKPPLFPNGLPGVLTRRPSIIIAPRKRPLFVKSFTNNEAVPDIAAPRPALLGPINRAGFLAEASAAG